MWVCLNTHDTYNTGVSTGGIRSLTISHWGSITICNLCLEKPQRCRILGPSANTITGFSKSGGILEVISRIPQSPTGCDLLGAVGSNLIQFTNDR